MSEQAGALHSVDTEAEDDLPPRRLIDTEYWLGYLDGPLGIMVSFAFVAMLWEFTSTFLVNPYMIPPPSEVVRTAIPMFASGEILSSVGVSLLRVLVGFFLGSVTGIVFGVLMGRVRLLNRLLDPALELMRYLSPTAMIPIAIVWFGIGESSKYFLIFWGSFSSFSSTRSRAWCALRRCANARPAVSAPAGSASSPRLCCRRPCLTSSRACA